MPSQTEDIHCYRLPNHEKTTCHLNVTDQREILIQSIQ
jgi:hypothetical protein